MSERIENDALCMTPEMHAVLDKFFAEKTITDVDRNTFLVCNLTDKRYGIHISLVFMRDWHSIESNDYNEVALEDKGIVFTFPCYWISIPKELAIPYIEYIISEFYENTAKDWDIVQKNINSSQATGVSGSVQKPITPCPFVPAT